MKTSHLFAFLQLADAHPIGATAFLILFIAVSAFCIRVLSDLEATDKIPSAIRIVFTTILCLIVASWIGWQAYRHSTSTMEDPNDAVRSLK